MNILLIYPEIRPRSRNYPGYYYQGIGSLSASLKKHGHQVSLIHMLKFDVDCVLKKVLADKYHVIGFSATTNQFPYVKCIAEKIRNSRIKSFLICGGVHATLNPDEVIGIDSLDAACIGEGEGPLVELCNRLDAKKDISNIRNLWIKESLKIYKNDLRDYENLDELQFPDRDIFDYKSLLHERLGEASVMVSRGCPYECAYCCNKALKNVNNKSNRYVRFRSVDYAIDELKSILKKYNFVRAFAFDDDILPLNINWFESFALTYKKEIGLPFTCNIRPNLVDEQRMGLLKHAGCWRMHMGIESGNELIRNGILHRNISDKLIHNAIELAKKYGIKIYAYNMIGMPKERCSDVLDTIKMNVSRSIVHSQVSFYFPYKHTTLGTYCEQNGLISDLDVVDYFAETKLKFSQIHKGKLKFYIHNFSNLISIYRKLNILPSPISKICTTFADGIFSSSIGINLFKFARFIKNKILYAIRRLVVE